MFLSVSPRRFREPCVGRMPLYRMEMDVDEYVPSLSDILTPLHILSALTSSPTTQPKAQQCSRKRKEKEEQVEAGKKPRFEWALNVDGYNASEIHAKLVENNTLVVSGKHEHKADNGFVSRNFTRKFTIPDNVNLDELSCNLNAKENVMHFSAPWKVEVSKFKETVIPINLTGPVNNKETNEQADADSTNNAPIELQSNANIPKPTSGDGIDAIKNSLVDNKATPGA